MRSTALGALAVVGVLAGGLWGAGNPLPPSQTHSPVPATATGPARGTDGQLAAGSEWIALAAPAGENVQLLVVVDPKQEVLAVYHIDKPSGRVTLQSVRNIRWDLRLTEFNAERPLPNEIRALLEGR